MEIRQRIPEPHELMNDSAQAKAYAESDFTEPHDNFVDHFRELFPDFREGSVLDVGCGNADPTIRFARAYPDAKLLGIDGAEAMLAFGKEAIKREGLSEQIELRQELLKENSFSPRSFDAIICNSVLHHLEYPVSLWKAIKRTAKPGTPIFVMDLTRPNTTEEAEQLVKNHSNGAPELMRRDFYNSLLAAFRPGEVREQLAEARLSQLTVQKVSNRHIVIHGKA